MIVTSIDESFSLYRAHTPKWASEPLSGAGAALHGGRLNRPGMHALYLSTTQAAALAEYQQDEPMMPPCMLVAYRASITSVVDFRNGFAPGIWDPLWQDLGCNWRGLAMFDGVEPPSWNLGDIVLANRHSAIIYPSQRIVGGINIVIFTGALRTEDFLDVIDPGKVLPHDRSSWT